MAFGKQVSGQRAKELVEGRSNALLFDLCDPVSFRDGAIAGSTNLSLRGLSGLQRYPKNTPIVIMGDINDPKTLPAALNYLEGYGLTQVYWLASRSQYGN